MFDEAALPRSPADPTTSTAPLELTAANEATGIAPASLDRRTALAALAAIKVQTRHRFANTAVLNRIAIGAAPGFRRSLPSSRMTLIVSAIKTISTTMKIPASTNADLPVSRVSPVLMAGQTQSYRGERLGLGAGV